MLESKRSFFSISSSHSIAPGDEHDHEDISNILLKVGTYLDVTSLCNCSCVNKFFLQIFESDIIWKSLCVHRWYRQKTISSDYLRVKRYGKVSWKNTFIQHREEIKLPQGMYTHAYHKIFGRNLQNGVAAWLLIDHSNDCRLHQCKGEDWNEVVLHICIQNQLLNNNSMILIRLKSFVEVNMKDTLTSDGEKVTKVIAKNGLDYHSPDNVVELYPGEFVVVKKSIKVSNEFIFESDFLCALDCIVIKYQLSDNVNSESELVINPIEEKDIFKAYTAFSGRQMVKENFA